VGVTWIDEDRSISLDQVSIAVILIGIFPEITEEPFSEFHEAPLLLFNKRTEEDMSNGSPSAKGGAKSSRELDLLCPRVSEAWLCR
jgi:hypothetical protein